MGPAKDHRGAKEKRDARTSVDETPPPAAPRPDSLVVDAPVVDAPVRQAPVRGPADGESTAHEPIPLPEDPSQPFAAALSRRGALELLALLARAADPRDDAWQALLLNEPGLAAWIGRRARRAGRALHTTGDAAQWLAGHFLQECSPWPSADWIPAAIEKLARLATLEGQFQQALQREKLASLKELAYGAGHEINNPLANISARAQTLLQDERDPERRRRLAAINAQAFRAHEMIADLMLFARPPEPKLARVDVGELVASVVLGLAALAAEQQTEIRCEAPRGDVTALADATQLAVAVRALCVNALEALDQGGQVTVTIRADSASTLAAGGQIEIVVADTGPGISPAVAAHLFDPFFSGREAGRGLGFGLPKCWRIVANHGGRVDARNAATDGEGAGDAAATGAIFTIRIPRRRETSESTGVESADGITPAGR